MLDVHSHLDRYENPKQVAAEAAVRGVFTIAVTNLPSHFRAGLPYVQSFPRVGLALGLHPLAAWNSDGEHTLFLESLGLTSFVGEVGLDFSRGGKSSRDTQVANFRFVAGAISGKNKVVSLHSRGAESAVLDILTEFRVSSTIFHWYTGPLTVLDEAVSAGHFFSVNPAMIRSANGKRIIGRIPPNRILTETDGPFIHVGRSPARPWDVKLVEEYLAKEWNVHPEDAELHVSSNFQYVLSQFGIALSR